jgi:predicted component of type VI protein secretion system
MLEESLDRGGYKRDPRKIAELVVTSFSEGYEHLVMTHKAWQTLKAHIAEVIVKHMPRIKAARS